MRRFSHLHPIFVAFFPALFLAAHNIDSTPVEGAGPAIAFSVGLALLLWCAFRPLLGSWPKAALMTSITLAVFFSYGHLYSLFRPNLRHRTLLPIGFAILTAGYWATSRMRRDPLRLAQGMTLVSAFLVVSPLVSILFSKGTMPEPKQEAASRAPVASGGRPDIYYIILDGYAGEEALRNLYGYDNGAFLRSLSRRGFYVADGSWSNYAQTALSLASSANMDYLDGLVEPGSLPNPRDLRPLVALIENSRVLRFLKSRGYRIVNLQSGSSVTARNRNADWDVNCGGWGEFTRAFAGTTLPGSLGLFGEINKGTQRRVLCQFETLAEIQHHVPGPRYVFAHIVSPEPPILFGKNGESVEPTTAVVDFQWKERPLYAAQLEFLSRKAAEAIDRILAEAATPPIILLQSDHGSASTGYEYLYAEKGPPATGREPGIDALVRERMEILNAYYIPGGARDLYRSISPVNSFRVVLNHVFGESLPLLRDRQLFSRYAHPYRYVDVTDRLASGESRDTETVAKEGSRPPS